MWRQTAPVLEVRFMAFEKKQNASFALDWQVEALWLSALLHASQKPSWLSSASHF